MSTNEKKIFHANLGITHNHQTGLCDIYIIKSNKSKSGKSNDIKTIQKNCPSAE